MTAPLVARVLDDKGRRVKGQTVAFKVTSGGGAMFAGVGTTNDTGVIIPNGSDFPVESPNPLIS
ncbi:MAG TPA: hypothetical protein VGI83_07155, partial [Gemmatimonadales bacterium]